MMRVQKITIGYFISLYVLYRVTELALSFYVVMTSIYFLIPALGSLCIHLDFYLKAFRNVPSQKNHLIFSINLWDVPEGLRQLSKELHSEKKQILVFCTSEILARHPELIRELAMDGHLIANMGSNTKWSFGFQNTRKMRESIIETSARIEELSSQKLNIFRPPRGITTPALAKACKQIHYQVMGWKYKIKPGRDNNNRNLSRKLKRLSPGDIICMDIYAKSETAFVKEVSEMIQESGFKLNCQELQETHNIST